MTWRATPRGGQLSVQTKDNVANASFLALPAETPELVKKILPTAAFENQAVSLQGRNWGEARVTDEGTLTFGVDAKAPIFEVPLSNLALAKQGGKHDVVAEFAVDDTNTDKDQLVEISFYVPPTSTMWDAGAADAEGDEALPSGQLLSSLNETAKAMGAGLSGANDGDVPVASFEDVNVLSPRGRFRIDLYMNHLKLISASGEFKVQYKHLVRMFVLPKSNAPQTLVAISLDSPIRKGQTFYQHVLVNFPNDEQVDLEMAMADDVLQGLAAKGNKIERSLSGDIMEVFCKALRGVSGCKLTRPGSFKSARDQGSCVRCSYRADEGYLFPLERAFFYVQKPPILISFDDVAGVEFKRSDAVGSGTFDLEVRLTNDTSFQFRSIARAEYNNFFEFVSAKDITIDNLAEVKATAGGGGRARTTKGVALDEEDFEDDDEDDDDSEEEDEDFDLGKEAKKMKKRQREEEEEDDDDDDEEDDDDDDDDDEDEDDDDEDD